jgi:hypothetical protein
MNRLPTRYQLPLVAGVSLVVLLVVAAVVLLAGRLSPSPSPAVPSSAPPSPSASVDASTPEGAVGAFFEAFAQGRRTDDPSMVLGLTTGAESSAYRSVEAFLLGQKEVGKASITTILELENFSTTTDGDRSTVVFDFTEGGYDISLDTGEPLESPEVLPTTRVTVELVLSDGRWLVDSYESEL